MAEEKSEDTGLQDGMLEYYKEQAPFSDANIEARIEKEAFSITSGPPFSIGFWSYEEPPKGSAES